MSIKWTMDISKLEQQYIQALEKASQEINVTMLANMQGECPVKTGTLKRSLTFAQPIASGTKLTLRWGSSIIYAAKVEFENKSYIRTTLRKGEKEIVEIFKKYLQEAFK